MKKLTWQQWVAIGLIVAVVITFTVLHFMQPEISYAFAEVMAAGGFIVGAFTGYLLKKKNIVSTEQQ